MRVYAVFFERYATCFAYDLRDFHAPLKSLPGCAMLPLADATAAIWPILPAIFCRRMRHVPLSARLL